MTRYIPKTKPHYTNESGSGINILDDVVRYGKDTSLFSIYGNIPSSNRYPSYNPSEPYPFLKHSSSSVQLKTVDVTIPDPKFYLNNE